MLKIQIKKIIIFFALLLVFVIPKVSFGAIAFDTATDSGGRATNSKSWTHVVTGTNTFLVVEAYSFSDLSSATATYNSVSMTAINTQSNAGSGVFVRTFYLINPTTGSHTITVTDSGISLGGIAASYTGVKQSGQPDSQNTGSSSSSNTLTMSTTVVLTNSWLVSFILGAGDTPSGGTGTTRRVLDSSGFGTAIGDSNAPKGTGSQSMTWNINNTGTNTGIIISVSPVPDVVISILPPLIIGWQGYW